MKLELNRPFAGYLPIRTLCARASYRTVYEATDRKNTKVFLIVYDNETIPETMKGDTIKEFDIIEKLTDDIFPQSIERGVVNHNGHSMSFMSIVFFEHKTLRELVREQPLSEKTAIKLAHRMLNGLKELFGYTQGGGHFNICPDTVLVSTEENGELKPHIIGLEHASGACNGSTGFDVSTLDKYWRAPETYIGRFQPATDVYSMGVLIAYMIQGSFLRWKNDIVRRRFIKYQTIDMQSLCVSERLKPIIVKAINESTSRRYKDIEELDWELMEYLGIANTKHFDNFAMEDIKKKDDDNKKTNDDMKETKQSSNELHVNVKIAVREGEGLKAVAGMAEIKYRLNRDFVDIVSNKELAKMFSILPPNMLFYGPPGTGKTYISMRLAEECGLEFCSVKPSDLGSIWVHGSQSLIKELFEKAEQKAKKNGRGCLLLIDEFDAIVPKRTANTSDNQAGEVAEFLTQLNDCVEKNIYVIGTTNCLDRIDKAIIRKGRIDEIVYVGMPDMECRRQLFEIELQKRPHEEGIDINELARLTDGFTSSDISYMVKETARNAFEACLKKKGEDIVKINETMLKEVIKTTKPSVSRDDVKLYEKMRDEYVMRNENERPKIGFLV